MLDFIGYTLGLAFVLIIGALNATCFMLLIGAALVVALPLGAVGLLVLAGFWLRDRYFVKSSAAPSYSDIPF